MIPEVKSIFVGWGQIDIQSPEAETYIKSSDYGFGIELTIGSVGQEGADIFTFNVYTQDYWNEKLANNHPPKYGFLVLDKITKQGILDHIQKVISRCTGDSWQEIANKINKYWFWEFEGME